MDTRPAPIPIRLRDSPVISSLQARFVPATAFTFRWHFPAVSACCYRLHNLVWLEAPRERLRGVPAIFGIVVDGVFHTEEIVVKPMSTTGSCRPGLVALILRYLSYRRRRLFAGSVTLVVLRRRGARTPLPGPRCGSMRLHKSDKRTVHDSGSETGMAAEHHEPEAPAHPSDKNPEREQQSASADNPKNVGRGHPQRPADDIALLATRGEG